MLVLSNLMAQEDLKEAPYTSYVYGTSDTFLISGKPVTNREYIIYFMWTLYVHGADYPEAIFEIIPGGVVNKNEPLKTIGGMDEKLESYFNHAKPFVKGYIFNPKYIDYPVIGLSWYQACKMNKWLGDRYNESKLIRYKFSEKNLNQAGEDIFVTEAYLMGQYLPYNGRKEGSFIPWHYALLVPTFRLPINDELKIAKQKELVSQEFKSYPLEKKYFLMEWQNYFMTFYRGDLLLGLIFEPWNYYMPKSSDWDISKYTYEEMTLNYQSEKNGDKVLEVFQQNGQSIQKIENYDDVEKKDSLGILPYLIVDETDAKMPIIIENYKKGYGPKEDPSKFYFFRFACSMSPNQFKP